MIQRRLLTFSLFFCFISTKDLSEGNPLRQYLFTNRHEDFEPPKREYPRTLRCLSMISDDELGVEREVDCTVDDEDEEHAPVCALSLHKGGVRQTYCMRYQEELMLSNKCQESECVLSATQSTIQFCCCFSDRCNYQYRTE
ncbi:unnamed protein product, partial [Mesorhabditis belari]|uniref:Uncharacterized protein n=1 Tax=Mesorhabditis belari TaxID=2138241 RepID=A0AAF3J3Y2_9BILA